MDDRYTVECCDDTCPHQDILSRVQRAIPDEDTLYDLSLIHI